ncbi:MAG: hypothetical protein ACM34H_08095 [Deltaproteobacteria bacterium]
MLGTVLLGFLQSWVCAGTYHQTFDRGRVDWTNGMVEVYAMGAPPARAVSAAQARALAESKAETLARNDLIGLLESLRVDSKSTVKEALEHRGARDEFVAAILRESYVVERSFAADGTVRVAVAFKLNGSFADLVLPKSIVSIKTVEQFPTKDESFTGLIIDCRGIPLIPALAPMVVDEAGQVVYGTAYVSRDYAMEEGMAAYARGMAKTKDNPRAGPKPLIVKGLRTVKARPSDVMISNADAMKIKGSGGNIGLLHRGRVLFVME